MKTKLEIPARGLVIPTQERKKDGELECEHKMTATYQLVQISKKQKY